MDTPRHRACSPRRRGGAFHLNETDPSTRYVLGHSDRELARLTRQGAQTQPITREFLVAAGVTDGMRVLDVGTGAGDVAFLASELVGDNGWVVGIDREPEVLALARERAGALGLRNVSFQEADASNLTFESSFDAVIGRYVLQFQPEPESVLRRLVNHLRPGGLVAIHESDWTSFKSIPSVHIWDRCGRLATEALKAGGAETQTGTKLPSIFAAAGLPSPSMRMTTIVGAGAQSRYACTRAADLVLTLLPSIESLGLVKPGELNPETLAEQMMADVSASGSMVIAWSEVAAWCRVLAPARG